MRHALRRAIVRAAPTCTLWGHCFNRQVLTFRPYQKWHISHWEWLMATG